MKKIAGCFVKKWVTALKIDALTEFIDQLSKSFGMLVEEWT